MAADAQKADPQKAKIWIKASGPDGNTVTIKVKHRCFTQDLRGTLSNRVRVPTLELEMELDGKVLWDARAQPLEGLEPSKVRVQWRRTDRLKRLLDKNRLPGLNALGKLSRTVVHFSVLDSDLDITREILDHKDLQPGLVNVQDQLGDTPLTFASILGQLDLVELLVDRKADLERQNICGRNALMLASEHGHHKVVTHLLTMGADVAPTPSAGLQKQNPVYVAELNERHRVSSALYTHFKAEATKETLFD